MCKIKLKMRKINLYILCLTSWFIVSCGEHEDNKVTAPVDSVSFGWHLSTYKKTLPNGDRVYGYSQSDRKHGNRILIIGAICFLVGLTYRISTTMRQ